MCSSKVDILHINESKLDSTVRDNEVARGYLIKLCSERLRPEVQSLTLIYTIFDKRYPFRVSSIEKLYPFHISAS